MKKIEFDTENPTADELAYIESHKGKILNPRLDSTFKAIFTQPTDESRIALHDFLEAAIGEDIADVSFEPNDAVQDFAGQRDVDYDINVHFSTGEAAEIEMQAWQQKYDFGKRAEYQAARLLGAYLNKGESWGSVKKVYQISILDYNYKQESDADKENDSVLTRYTMKGERGERLADRLNVIFIELTKLGSAKKYSKNGIAKLTKAEKWALFFKKADNSSSSGIVSEIAKTEVGIMNAQKVLSSISSDRALLLAQYHAEVRERDMLSNIEGSFKQGVKQGVSKGIEELKTFLALGIPVEEAMEKVMEQNACRGPNES
ncbi:MAG: Rpn family recombination-promoting nuclease/putative transposase [Treponema sp.]|nr:Rpn family recombination-promoting nuclease/putative transposase [Treponema sp.]